MINFAVGVSTNSEEQPYYWLRDIITVNGFTLGEEGTIEVPEWDRITLISNGRRQIQELTMTYRLISDWGKHEYVNKTDNYLLSWFGKRGGDNRDIRIDWIARDWKSIISTWTFESCEFLMYQGEDQDFADPKVGIIEVKFAPYDVSVSTKDAGLISPIITEDRNATDPKAVPHIWWDRVGSRTEKGSGKGGNPPTP